ncbi:MAG TPA: cell division protein FtsA [Candidatus Angelobacter sp.]|jgi:cell division protein FtsA|nr:cell division protein FtsA [Candidatus Angelobacter sp.]
MGKDQRNIIAVLDVGSAKTVALICDVSDSSLRYRGHATTESRGSRKGVLVELDKAVQSIQRAVEAAEKMAEATVGNAVISIGGAHIKGLTSRGGISLGSRPREVTREDVRTAVEKARSINLPPDREILHLLHQEFILDDQAGVRDPVGMMASRMEVNLHMVTASGSAMQNIVTCANKAGVHVDNTVYEALVAADCTLRAEEKDMGVCLVDIGAGSSDLIVYFEGMAVHSGVVPVGGDHFTNDVAVGLRTPLVEAEKIKKLFGNTISSKVPEANEIEVPAVGDRPSRLMPQRFLAEILEPRATELCELLRDHLQHAGVLELCTAGIVLTGGGAKLNGLPEIFERMFQRPIRLAGPGAIAKMPVQLAEPEFAAVIGLAMYAHRTTVAKISQEHGFGSRLRSLLARLGA